MPFRPVPRLRHFEYRGAHRYFVTICVRNRVAVFTSPAAVAPVLSQLRHTADTTGFAIVAYCFMPDHLHLLVEGATEHARFLQFMRVFKQRSSFRWKQRTGGELWQRGYFEHVLRDDEDLVATARYVLANPVRAGLAASPTEYPFIGSLSLDLRDLLGSL